MAMKKLCFVLTALFLSGAAYSQEALKSVEEEYYDFLSLTGLAERPTLGYRTLSDNEWVLSDDARDAQGNVWKENNIGTKRTLYRSESPAENWFTRGIDQSIRIKAYGPEWYNSYNTAAPYGQNDGALWQGKGYNTSLTGGVRFEGYGLELTFKPQLSFSQNAEFDLMDNSAYYSNEYAYVWGYGNDVGADAPQRFGDSSFFTYDWGDTEIRYTWHSLTMGFGTQSIWLGPAYINPLLHSNNAASYPKFDIGLRKTKVNLPFVDWYIGDIEARLWIGRLTESDYFDNDSSNDHNQITGMAFSYAPSFLQGLTLTANKICLSKWDDEKAIRYLNPFYDVNDSEDQKMSLSADWLFPQVGLDIYGELGIDDYILGYHHEKLLSILRNPFHTMTYTFGLKKSMQVSQKRNILGELIFEWNNTEMSQDFQFEWPYNFGFHHLITQGYTNAGQWIGSGIGYGGNSQMLAFNILYPKGNTLLFVQRNNPDNNYIYSKTITTASSDKDLYYRWYVAYKSNFNIGFSTNYFITEKLSSQIGFIYNLILNNEYNPSKASENSDFYRVPTELHNFHFNLGAEYNF